MVTHMRALILALVLCGATPAIAQTAPAHQELLRYEQSMDLVVVHPALIPALRERLGIVEDEGRMLKVANDVAVVTSYVGQLLKRVTDLEAKVAELEKAKKPEPVKAKK